MERVFAVGGVSSALLLASYAVWLTNSVEKRFREENPRDMHRSRSVERRPEKSSIGRRDERVLESAGWDIKRANTFEGCEDEITPNMQRSRSNRRKAEKERSKSRELDLCRPKPVDRKKVEGTSNCEDSNICRRKLSEVRKEEELLKCWGLDFRRDKSVDHKKEKMVVDNEVSTVCRQKSLDGRKERVKPESSRLDTYTETSIQKVSSTHSKKLVEESDEFDVVMAVPGEVRDEEIKPNHGVSSMRRKKSVKGNQAHLVGEHCGIELRKDMPVEISKDLLTPQSDNCDVYTGIPVDGEKREATSNRKQCGLSKNSYLGVVKKEIPPNNYYSWWSTLKKNVQADSRKDTLPNLFGTQICRAKSCDANQGKVTSNFSCWDMRKDSLVDDRKPAVVWGGWNLRKAKSMSGRCRLDDREVQSPQHKGVSVGEGTRAHAHLERESIEQRPTSPSVEQCKTKAGHLKQLQPQKRSVSVTISPLWLRNRTSYSTPVDAFNIRVPGKFKLL